MLVFEWLHSCILIYLVWIFHYYSLKTISSENGSLSKMQKAMEDAAVIGNNLRIKTKQKNFWKRLRYSFFPDIVSEATAVSSANNSKQCVTTTDTDQPFDYPISIITRPSSILFILCMCYEDAFWDKTALTLFLRKIKIIQEEEKICISISWNLWAIYQCQRWRTFVWR